MNMIHLTPLSNLLRQSPWRLKLLHSSPQTRVLWLTHGQGRVLMDGRRMGTGIHNFLVIPAGAVFVMEPSAQTNGVLLDTGAVIPSLPATPVLLRIRDVGPQGEIAGLLDRMQKEQTQGRSMSEPALQAHLNLVSIWCARELLSDETPVAAPKATTRLMRSFMTTLEAHYSDGWDVQKIAQHLDVTPTHLSRACKRHLGRTAATLLTERLTHSAMTQLLDGSDAVKDIAAGLGFRSAAYFSRFVLAHTGYSPRDLRKLPERRAA